MNDKQQILSRLNSTYLAWESMLSKQQAGSTIHSLSKAIIHLWAWQQIAIARIEAAISNREPTFPNWPTDDPDSEEDIDMINAWIQSQNQHKKWSQIYTDWRTNFRYLITLTEKVTEEELSDKQKYSWLKGYSLYDVLEGSINHHKEHLDEVMSKQFM